MRKIKEALLFIHERGLSQNQTALALSLSRSTIQDYLARAQASGLPIEALRALDPEKLEAALFPTDLAREGGIVDVGSLVPIDH